MVSQKDKGWGFKESACTLLSLIPVLGFFSFIYMYHRTGRKQYRKLAILYGAFHCLGFFSFQIWAWIEFDKYTNVFRVVSYLCEIIFQGRLEFFIELYSVPLLYLLVYVACICHTMALRKGYLRYMREVVSLDSQKTECLADRGWRRRNQGWMVFGFAPLFGGLALCFAGRKMGRKLISHLGKLHIALSVFLFLLMQWFYSLGNTFSEAFRYLFDTLLYSGDKKLAFDGFTRIDRTSAACGIILVFLFIACILLTFLYRRDYFVGAARQWETDIAKYPSYGDIKWRRKQSGWQVWTFIPVVGGVGLIQGGRLSRNKKATQSGIFLLVLNGLLFLLFLIIGIVFNNIATAFYNAGMANPIAAIGRFLSNHSLVPLFAILWLVSVYEGCLYRHEILLSRAEILGKYNDDLEIEISLQKRYRSRGVQQSVSIPPIKPKKASVPKPQKDKLGSVSADVSLQEPLALKIDINSCTQAELTTLPGITLSDAQRAIQYREDHHGFRSVDEFIDALSIQPHLAVQIFKMAEVVELLEEKKENPSSEVPHRRSIDL